MPKLKYKEEIDSIGCKLEGFSEQKRIAFRWTFDKIDDTRNFLPRNLLRDTSDTCKGWGLSFFNSREAAEVRLFEIVRERPFLTKKLGDHLAEGDLVEDDGISDNAQENGHYTHFEYEGIDLAAKFTILGKIV